MVRKINVTLKKKAIGPKEPSLSQACANFVAQTAVESQIEEKSSQIHPICRRNLNYNI